MGTALSVPSTNPETTLVSNPLSGTTPVFITSFITEAGVPNVESLPIGINLRQFFAVTGAANEVAAIILETWTCDADGSNQILHRSTTSPNISNVLMAITQTTVQPVAVAMTPTQRLIYKMYGARVSGPSSFTITVYFNGSTHVSLIQSTLSTLVQGDTGYTGATGATGATGVTGATGPIGLSLSYAAGNYPYTYLGTVTVTTAPRLLRLYEVGPITATSTSKFYITANVLCQTPGVNAVITVGRSTISGAAVIDSMNIVNGMSMADGLFPGGYLSAVTSYSFFEFLNMQGSAIDSPGPGIFYYTIWINTPSNYTDIPDVSAMLSVLTIQM